MTHLRIPAAVAAALLVAGAAFATPPPLPPPDEIAAAVEREVASGAYQTDLPEIPDAPEPRTINFPFADELAWLAKWTLIAGGAFVAFLMLRAIYLRLSEPAGARKTKPKPERAGVVVSATEREAEADPDALAAAGDFAAAIRVLFARALVAAARALSRETPPSDTGREALRRLDPPDAALAHLSTLARKVEAAVFADLGANAGDYDDAKAALGALRRALEPGRA